MRRTVTRLAALFGLLGSLGFTSSSQYKAAQLNKKEGEKHSLSGYAENNFHALQLKRTKGKWRVRK